MTRFFYIRSKGAAMHYPVNVFVGKVRDYDGSRPSAIGKIQVDGELTLGELGLEGDEQAETKIHGGRTARCATIPVNTTPIGLLNFRSRRIFSAPRRLARISRPKG
jgi:hypothetical protein